MTNNHDKRKNNMLDFKTYESISEFMNECGVPISEFTCEKIDNILNEKISSGWMKALSFGMLAKAQSYSSKVKAEKDLEKKLNLLADLIKTVAYLSNLSVATAAMDKTIAKAARK